VGKNTIGSVPTAIAKYLKLDHPESYTSHCLRLLFGVYDSVLRNKLYEAMDKPDKFVRITKATIRIDVCKVQIQGNLSENFEANTVLRQWDDLECLIFNIALEKAIRAAETDNRKTILNKSLQYMACAEDP